MPTSDQARSTLVTDLKAYEDGIKAFAWMMPCEVKVFAVADQAAATTWVTD